jgi:hypothetical protein
MVAGRAAQKVHSIASRTSMKHLRYAHTNVYKKMYLAVSEMMMLFAGGRQG